MTALGVSKPTSALYVTVSAWFEEVAKGCIPVRLDGQRNLGTMDFGMVFQVVESLFQLVRSISQLFRSGITKEGPQLDGGKASDVRERRGGSTPSVVCLKAIGMADEVRASVEVTALSSDICLSQLFEILVLLFAFDRRVERPASEDAIIGRCDAGGEPLVNRALGIGGPAILRKHCKWYINSIVKFSTDHLAPSAVSAIRDHMGAERGEKVSISFFVILGTSVERLG